MTFPIISRQTAALVANGPTASLHRPLMCYRIERRRHAQARSLWWWSRHGAWTTSGDEHVEDKMQKHQKIMRYRYSRALKRRALWERDNSPPSWAVRSPSKWFSRAWACKPISTTSDMQARLKEETTGISPSERTWKDAERDFEAFKAEIDRAIAKDPVGFLFGRRLQGPLSTNNSSWTSFARIFDSKESQETFEANHGSRKTSKRIKIEDLDKKYSSEAISTSSQQPGQSQGRLSYVYDPISGRNVPKKEETKETRSFTDRLFGSLFAEHQNIETNVDPKPKQDPQSVQPKRFENSRKREYQQLRTSTLGNNLDTTAEFGGKVSSIESAEVKDQNQHNSALLDNPVEVPPFTGTIYDPNSDIKPSRVRPNTSWLAKEGFQEQRPQPNTKGSAEKLQSSFDRMQTNSEYPEKRFISKLQPAVDRITLHKPTLDTKPTIAPLNMTSRKPESAHLQDESVVDRREDLDLLRPSDVRAATRTARITKSQTDQAKVEARQKLEQDFKQREGRDDKVYLVEPNTRLSKMLSGSSYNSIAKHIQRYPAGIVVKTLQAVNLYSDKHGSLSNSITSRMEPAERITNDQDATNRLPSIYKEKLGSVHTKVSDIPSREVMAMEKAKEGLKRTIQQFNNEVQARVSADSKRISDLARALREVYESEKGLIQANTEINTTKSTTTPIQTGVDLSPLKSASVKPGVQTYPHIERHTQEFEPKLVEIREKAKGVKRSLFEITTTLQSFEKIRPADQTSGLETTHAEHKLEKHDQTSGADLGTRKLASDEKQRLSAMRALNARIKQDPHLLEKQICRPYRPDLANQASASVPSKHQPRQDEAINLPISPYVILTYNRTTGDVDTTELDSLIGETTTGTAKMNPIVVMSNLNYPAAFVSHFVTLEKAGYSLVNGGGDLLVFQKQSVHADADQVKNDAFASIRAIKSDIKELKNKIAEEEAKHQPQVEANSRVPKSAANVLDEMPTDIPPPGPAAPTAPTGEASTNSKTEANALPKKKDRKMQKIRRQEQVFTGTIRPNRRESKFNAEDKSKTASASDSLTKASLFLRFIRAIRRAILTTLALGVGAYTIGIVSEGIGAHTQAVQGVASSSTDTGPRKKVVMPHGQRAGIYSTESSRAD